MKWTRTAETLAPDERHLVGGKAWRLARLAQQGFPTPPWVCLTTRAYDAYLDVTGLRERIALEVHRKAFEAMRWEELWDCATRIRNLFLQTPVPEELGTAFESAIKPRIGGRAAVVRSSAIDEDTGQASFAGLHDSYVNIRGLAAILRHVRLVWASLWSDAALLYRHEIGLDIGRSAMAVLVQVLEAGQSSGVAFTVDPVDEHQAVIEAVHGLNQGLVDGTIEPDRWTLRRDREQIVAHTPARRQYYMVPGEEDIRKVALPADLAGRPPLSPEQVLDVYRQARNVEAAFDQPQDVEWTISAAGLSLLQARPITTRPGSKDDQRGWYLSLHKSFDQLVELRDKIENEHIPAMIEAARKLARVELASLSDHALAAEIKRRWELNQHWSAVYWADFIPYAHGVRLFGQYYNDRVNPEDPYEFIDLLTQTGMESLARNELLEALAEMVRADAGLLNNLSDTLDANPFEHKLKTFLAQYGDLSTGVTGGRTATGDLSALAGFIAELAGRPHPQDTSDGRKDPDRLKAAFLNSFGLEERRQAESLLDLARNSYQLRDDDNIHLGRIEAQYMAAVQAGRQRLATLADKGSDVLAEILDQVNAGDVTAAIQAPADARPVGFRQRQLVGQPAGPGLVKAPARVITAAGQLLGFKSGEILVCDAVDPNMTFVIPLAAGIVERRGGMLIHGAIIAREYGLPCVTGVPHAAVMIKTGDMITVDGYLGIVTVE
jgi:pyruvate,water dikinase